MRFFRLESAGRHLRAGDRAMLLRRWNDAARHYAVVLRKQPGNVPIWIQNGHALKELGHIDAAQQAYEAAVRLDPRNTDARLHLAIIKRDRGLLDQAIDDFTDILRMDPTQKDAYAAIVHSGARERLPDNLPRELAATSETRIAALSHQLEQEMANWIEVSTYSIRHYDAFRHDFAIKPPPSAAVMPVTIQVDARGIAPYFIRATLLSLIDQSDAEWRAVVIADPGSADHSVASLAIVDDRISFVGAFEPTRNPDNHDLHLSAGTVLDPVALAWFKFVIGRTGCHAAWCDFDHASENWSARRRYERPQLWGVFDGDLMAQACIPPAVVWCASRISVADDVAAERRRSMLLEASIQGPIAHIPRILASVMSIPPRADIAPVADDDTPIWSSDPRGSPPRAGDTRGEAIILRERIGRPTVSVAPVRQADERIDVIIQTRDEVALLEKAVTSIVRMASRPERISLTIVNNRSQDRKTLSYLDDLSARKAANILPLDSPFNWSHANNLAASVSHADNLVFANNDVEMLTLGWDDLLLGYLQRPDVAVVGARLLYPDGTLQHGGILFGLGEGGPIHEGAHSAAANTGPQDRFDLTRSCAAVTGAFMAIRRPLFEKLGGFDGTELAIGYNDIDLCLRARSEGLRVLYAPLVELIHHESRTRGMNVSRNKVAWDLGERRSLYMRWREDMMIDPGYNPHWSLDHPFAGFTNPTMQTILTHIDRSARGNPWETSRIDR